MTLKLIAVAAAMLGAVTMAAQESTGFRTGTDTVRVYAGASSQHGEMARSTTSRDPRSRHEGVRPQELPRAEGVAGATFDPLTLW